MGKLPKASYKRTIPRPEELKIDDFMLFIGGWRPPSPGDRRALKSEEEFHEFLKCYGKSAHHWKDAHPPEGYDLQQEIAKIHAWRDEPDPRL
ncbi:hypothetical protein MYX82_03240 [Acidobacteria bacterium AH-259-D05]|nr:hypothetical protein [Acidobacteria bacterium AH-259-D05]